MNTGGKVSPAGSLKVKHIRPWGVRMRLFQERLDNAKRFAKRVLFTIRAIPAGLRGELTVARAELSAVLIRVDGTEVNYGIVSRKKVTRAFVLDIVDAMVDAASAGQHPKFNDYKFHDSGVGTTAEANTDTGMETTDGEARSTGSQVDNSSASQGIYTSVGTILYTTTKAITEHGLFNESTGGVLLDRSVFAVINVVNGDSIQFTYTLTINPEA